MAKIFTDQALALGKKGLRWANGTEGRWTTGGLALGVAQGLAIGGMGLAGGFGGIALSGPLVVGAGAALVANRIGVAHQRRIDRDAAFIGPQQPSALRAHGKSLAAMLSGK